MYKIIFDGIEEDELYETYEEAQEAADEMASNASLGFSLLFMANPGDYEEESDGNTCDYEIIEV